MRLNAQGSATGIPAWGKFWLSILNCYEWCGMNPVPPELWLLPTNVPIHPSKMWIHTRQVYLPMGYLYGIKYQAPMTPLIEALRTVRQPAFLILIQGNIHNAI